VNTRVPKTVLFQLDRFYSKLLYPENISINPYPEICAVLQIFVY